MVEIEIINKCKKSDQAAYRKMYNSTLSYLKAICRRYNIKDNDIRDVLQEIYAQLFFSITKYDSKKGEFKPWLRKVSVNIILKHIRKQNIPFLHIDQMNIESNEYKKIDFKLDNHLVNEALEKLPIGYKTIFNLSVIDGYKHKEIGKLLGISETTSRSQLSRAKAILRKHLSSLNENISYGTL